MNITCALLSGCCDLVGGARRRRRAESTTFPTRRRWEQTPSACGTRFRGRCVLLLYVLKQTEREMNYDSGSRVTVLFITV